jgi:threonine dehydrogenase-like Zn-dependent dehydrogenase
MEKSKFKRQMVVLDKEGKLKMTSEETLPLKNNQVLIKVKYAPVSNYDKSCVQFKRDQMAGKDISREALGSEGSGIIE